VHHDQLNAMTAGKKTSEFHGRLADGPDERGMALILVALTIAALLVLAGLVLDIGNAKQDRRQAQNAADAAALAGAQAIASGTTTASTLVSLIKRYVANNYGTVTWAGCSDPSALAVTPDSGASDTCISWDKAPPATTTVRVVLPARIEPRFFGPSSITVGAHAVAMVAASGAGTAPCALCLLNTTGTTLTLSGSSEKVQVTADGSSVSGPGIIDNSSSMPAMTMTGSSDTISAPSIGVVGTATSSGAGDSYSPTPTSGISPITDPLASLPIPSVTGTSTGTCATYYSGGTVSLSGSSQSCTMGPGVYSNIVLSGSSDSITLQAGTYVLTGSQGLAMSGSSDSLTAIGVTIYLTCAGYKAGPPATGCASASAGAPLSLSGSSDTFNVQPPAAGTYQGLTIFSDRLNNSALTMSGSSGDTVSGTIYAKLANFALSGSSGGTFPLNSMIVVGQATLSGSADTISLAYKTTSNVPFTSGGPSSSYLGG